MDPLHLEIAGGRTSFRPGEIVTGSAAWDLSAAPPSAEVRLFWRTEGKGTTDTGTADAVRFDAPAARDRRDFRFTLPGSPYSFSGKLISLVWAVELVVGPKDAAARAGLVLSPTGSEIRLGAGDT